MELGLKTLGIVLLIIAGIVFLGYLYSKWEDHHATSCHEKNNKKDPK